MKCLFGHKFLAIEEKGLHFWTNTQHSKWYKESVGEAVCTQCGHIKHNHRYALPHMPTLGNHANV